MAASRPRSFRIADPLWNVASRIAARRDETISSILTATLRRYVRQYGTTEEQAEIEPAYLKDGD